MTNLKSFYFYPLIFFIILFSRNCYSDNHNLYEVLELIQKDLKTLERAVYSDSFSLNNETTNNTSEFNQNSEEVLTRHLLKLSDIENQFQILTNKFEEINFKLDKLSSRLSKVQADNQLRFQQLEERSFSNVDSETQQLSSTFKTR